MAKLDTFVELLTSTLGALSSSSVGTGNFSIVSAALQVDTGSGSDYGSGGTGTGFGDDIDESSAYFEITALPTGGRCDITVVDASENGYRIRLSTTQITTARLVGGSPTTIAGPTTWSSASHKWVRFREASGTFYVEAAPDNGSGAPGTFSTLASESTGTTGMTHTAVNLAWFAPASVGAGVSRFRYLNTSAPAPAGHPTTKRHGGVPFMRLGGASFGQGWVH